MRKVRGFVCYRFFCLLGRGEDGSVERWLMLMAVSSPGDIGNSEWVDGQCPQCCWYAGVVELRGSCCG